MKRMTCKVTIEIYSYTDENRVKVDYIQDFSTIITGTTFEEIGREIDITLQKIRHHFLNDLSFVDVKKIKYIN